MMGFLTFIIYNPILYMRMFFLVGANLLFNHYFYASFQATNLSNIWFSG